MTGVNLTNAIRTNIQPTTNTDFVYKVDSGTVTAETLTSYLTSLEVKVNGNIDTIDSHLRNLNNPHNVTKLQLGLENVDNTSDLNKPISTATQTALNNKQDTISDLSSIREGANLGSTAIQSADLSTVATTGSYNDLSDKPVIGDATVTIRTNSTTTGSFTTNSTTATTIDLVIPTTVAELSDSSSYYTSSQVDAKIGEAVSSVYKFKGTVASYDQLPTTDLTQGDVYNVEDTGANYCWTGNTWDKLSEDLSNYVTLEGNQVLKNKTIALSDNTITGLSTVATSGSYTDLTNKPSIPTVDQTYNSTSSNAVSGVAISNAGFQTANDVATAIDAINPLNKIPFYTESSSSSVQLQTNTCYKITIEGNTIFSLPTPTTGVLNQIEVQMYYGDPRSYDIDLGTTHYLGNTVPDMSTAGYYNIIWEYDWIQEQWFVGVIYKGA